MVGLQERTAKRLHDLYDTHAGEALRLAYLLTGEQELAEHLVQDAFVRVAGRFQDLRDPGAFGVYLKRAVVTIAHSTRRQREVDGASADVEGREEPAGLPSNARDHLWREVLQLPARERTAVVLRFSEDMSDEQIAQVIGAPTRAVRSLLSGGSGRLSRTYVGDLENALTETLREHAGAAPMPGALPRYAARRARHRRLGVAGGSFLSAAAAITVIAIGSQAVLAGPGPAPLRTEAPGPLPSPTITQTPAAATTSPSHSEMQRPSPSPSATATEEPLATPTLPPVTATAPEAVRNDEQPNPGPGDWGPSVDCRKACVQWIFELDERVVDIASRKRAGAWVLTEEAVHVYDGGWLGSMRLPNKSGKPTSITASENYVYVAAGSHVFRLTVDDLDIETASFEGKTLRELAFGGGYLWVSYTDDAGGGVARVGERAPAGESYWGDSGRWTPRVSIALPNPTAIAVTGRYAWVVSGTALRRIDIATVKPAGGIETGEDGPRPLVPSGDSIWTRFGGHTVEIDSTTGVVTAAYPVLGLIMISREGYVLVTDPEEQTLYRIAANTGEIDYALLIDAAPLAAADGGAWSLLGEADGQGSSRIIDINPGH